MTKKQYPLFWDGNMVSADEKRLQGLAPGRIQGRGVFETIRVDRGIVLFRREHLRRLHAGLKALGIKPAFSPRHISQGLTWVCEHMKERSFRVRINVWQQRHQSHVAIAAQSLSHLYLKPQPIKACFVKKRYDLSQSSSVKSIRYASFLKAHETAQREGCDEALLINQKGHVAEGSRTNLFYIHQGTVYTPHLKSGGLKGIVRQQVIRLCRSQGLRCRQIFVLPEALLNCDEAFVTNSLKGIVPVRAIDRKRLGHKRPGPMTRRLQKAYARACREKR